MRLAQIARKLKVKTSEVVAFVDQKFEEQIVHAPNTKIPDDYVNDIIEHFTVEEKAESEVKATPESTIIEEPKGKIIAEEETHEIIEQTEVDEQVESIEESEETHELNIEDGVIKAPKTEVQGIKVVGKIELPGDKPKETERTPEDLNDESAQEEKTVYNADNPSESTEEEKSNAEVKKEVETPTRESKPVQEKKKVTNKKGNKSRKNKNSLTYEEERNLAQKKYREELQKQKEIDKKKKKAKYEQMMQKKAAKSSSNKSKQKKKSKQTPKTISKKQVQQKEKPTSLWGRFIYWLNH
ncbi:hypothetical protein [Brumimicrobium oceani]|uniref:Uncharacterized protein n=1 Tax=Brumimicrobium oceani TaxID=2100725 RepID=A0A2U2XE34_9FLAO|nr:hypothetical protein [Brumimicrobium oceani]PWH86062.1 hypothetical protein DIT68_05765 [Brumimicrobium oceani]